MIGRAEPPESSADDVRCPSADELRALSAARIPGRQVLDITPGNACEYCCGSFALVERDFNAVLPPSLAEEARAALCDLGLPQAFRSREELVNYKKVLLHVNQQGISTERSLSQLVAFFRDDRVRCRGGFSLPSERLGELSDLRARCKGRCEAAYDARLVGKSICNLPRHPDKLPCASLQDLPRSLRCWKIGNEAMADVKTYIEESQTATPAFSSTATLAAAAAVVKTSFHTAALEAIAAQPWPEHVREFVRLVLVSRGGDKALRVRDQLRATVAALQETLSQAEDALVQIQKLGPGPDETARRLEEEAGEDVKSHVGAPELLVDATAIAECVHRRKCMSEAMRRQRHLNLLSGCVPPLREAVYWLRAIDQSADSGDKSRLFVAGDGRGIPTTRYGKRPEPPPALCVPAGFQGGRAPEDECFQRALGTYGPQMRQTLAMTGWPAHISERLGASQNPEAADKKNSAHPCRTCNRGFSAIWVHRGICCECEESARARGQCPFREGSCSSSWFCPHDRRCLLCDLHSCEECRFSRGDADHVLQVAMRLQPQRIALDFDRTLATTRTGGEPIIGKHTVDTDLLSLFWHFPGKCAVVTRNSHKEAILAFLKAHGAPADLPVHVLKRPRSKAEFVAPNLQDGERAIFVDDAAAELGDPLVASDTKVHRVLFVRGLL